ncbi:MAG: tRNA (uridine(34)/cytosine(34)/5-carboxymethylaminomethyluridine(34)-2'-O)-methyltransferase TrmL [Clostridia bacterium]
MKLNIVLVEPEIPQNTGNIVRTCVATNSVLHLVRPLGFDVSDKQLKRAGLDYWNEAEINYYDSVEEVIEKYKENNFYFFTTKGQKIFSDIVYKDNDFLVFGKETHGLPEPLLLKHYENAVRIPMFNDTRSLNLSNSVAIAIYEYYRQDRYESLNPIGHLTGRKD